jgi:hypothetical protein
MRIFWHQGGLHVHPEDEHEGRLLTRLLECLKFERPPEMQGGPSTGNYSSGDDALNDLMANHGVRPSNIPGKGRNNNAVIAIHKRA